MPVAIAFVTNARHSPPPISVKVTLLPVPQVVADANAGKEKATDSTSRIVRMHDSFFCRVIDILKWRLEAAYIVYRYKPHIATCVSTATLVVVPPALLKRQAQLNSCNYFLLYFIRSLRHERGDIHNTEHVSFRRLFRLS